MFSLRSLRSWSVPSFSLLWIGVCFFRRARCNCACGIVDRDRTLSLRLFPPSLTGKRPFLFFVVGIIRALPSPFWSNSDFSRPGGRRASIFDNGIDRGPCLSGLMPPVPPRLLFTRGFDSWLLRALEEEPRNILVVHSRYAVVRSAP